MARRIPATWGDCNAWVAWTRLKDNNRTLQFLGEKTPCRRRRTSPLMAMIVVTPLRHPGPSPLMAMIVVIPASHPILSPTTLTLNHPLSSPSIISTSQSSHRHPHLRHPPPTTGVAHMLPAKLVSPLSPHHPIRHLSPLAVTHCLAVIPPCIWPSAYSAVSIHVRRSGVSILSLFGLRVVQAMCGC